MDRWAKDEPLTALCQCSSPGDTKTIPGVTYLPVYANCICIDPTGRLVHTQELEPTSVVSCLSDLRIDNSFFSKPWTVIFSNVNLGAVCFLA
jgi:hypothetical protein